MSPATVHLESTGRQGFLERQPTYWLKRSYQALRRRVDNDLRPFGITLSQRDVLLTLRTSGPMALGTLREGLGLEQSSVSRLVDGLARRGLVTVVEDESDRRARVASLTVAGHSLVEETPGASRLAGAMLSGALTPEETETLISLLRRCTAAFESEALPPPSKDGQGARTQGTAGKIDQNESQ